ncbi:hypothetical protein CsSME_00052701 [Camellia sinensis var. sinensis]
MNSVQEQTKQNKKRRSEMNLWQPEKIRVFKEFEPVIEPLNNKAKKSPVTGVTGRYGRYATVTTAMSAVTADTPVNFIHTAKSGVTRGAYHRNRYVTAETVT